VEKFFAGIFGMGVKGHKLELIDASGDGDVLFGTAKWAADGKDQTGKDQPWGGLATHIFQKQADGSLKLRVHIFN
jgi:ketosteroid isomerase-like protein